MNTEANKKKGKNNETVKKVLGMFAGVVILLLMFGLFMSLNSNGNDKVADKNPELMKQYEGKKVEDLHQSTIDALKDENYKYVTAPSKVQDMIKDKKDILVYAFSTECVHCKNLTPYMVDIMKQNEMDNVYFLNVLEYPNLYSDYKLEGTPTMIHYKDGKEVDRFIGDIGEVAVKEFFEKATK